MYFHKSHITQDNCIQVPLAPLPIPPKNYYSLLTISPFDDDNDRHEDSTTMNLTLSIYEIKYHIKYYQYVPCSFLYLSGKIFARK